MSKNVKRKELFFHIPIRTFIGMFAYLTAENNGTIKISTISEKVESIGKKGNV